MADLRRDFAGRAELVDYLRREFPGVAARGVQVAAMRGGRRAALAALAEIDPIAYAATRNMLDGAVTRLSPYLRHGLIHLTEVRRAALAKVADPHQAGKLLNELGWRDYFQRVYAQLGEGIWQDREPAKSGLPPSAYADTLPADIAQGETGLACIDAFRTELVDTGYLHNHVRMWLAAYIVHFRRVRWQAGARWFLSHLLDGDPAANNLSWQWVAGVFSQKPYFFNRENLEKYAGDRYCRRCALRTRCPLQGSYEALEQRLFEPVPDRTESAGDPALSRVPLQPSPVQHPPAPGRPVVWIHGDNLSPASPALSSHPAAPAIFVWDDNLLDAWAISFKRLLFLYESLLELPVVIRRGEVAGEVLRYVAEQGGDGVITNASASPHFTALRRQIEAKYPVLVATQDPFVTQQGEVDLRRFGRYWRKVGEWVFG